MSKRLKFMLLLIAALPGVAMAAHPLQVDVATEHSDMAKKYKLSACALFKNEAPYLKEWLEYHRMVGVDHFYLYDNGSQDHSIDVLAPYIKQGLVTLTHWPDRVGSRDDEKNAQHWALSTHLAAYENANKRYAIHDSQWFVVLDINEFIVPVGDNTVVDVLNHYDQYPGVELSSDFFDASDKDPLSKKDLLVTHTNLTARPTQNVLQSVAKMILKPESSTGFTWAPYRCLFREDTGVGRARKGELRINKYVNRPSGKLNFGKLKQKLRVDSRALTEGEKYELLETGYEIEDKEQAIHRFEPELRKRMGMKSTL